MNKDIFKREDCSISIDELENKLTNDRIGRENIEQTIFFGNGINLLSNKGISWKSILSSIGPTCTLKDVPYTLQYEDSFVNFSCTPKPKYSKEYLLKEQYLKPLRKLVSNAIYKLMANHHVKNFITTNYDDTLDKELKNNGYNGPDSSFKTTEKVYSIRRLHRFERNENDVKDVWYAHGEMKYPKSIMLGYDQYCGTIGLLNDYLKGNYTLPNGTKLPSMVQRIKDSNTDRYSWVDLFFMTDVHIIGFGLGYDETDIWWILNRRKRMLLEGKITTLPNNIYFYMNNPNHAQAKLLSDFGATVVNVNVKSGNYLRAYQRIISMI